MGLRALAFSIIALASLAGCGKKPPVAGADAAPTASASSASPSPRACTEGLARAPLDGYVTLAVATRAACAVHTSGRVACWGTWASWTAGTGDAYSSCADPAWVPGLSAITRLIGGSSSTFCAEDAERHAFCWGPGWAGTAERAEKSAPERAPAMDGATLALGTDGEHGCKLDPNGVVSCWGRGWQLGLASTAFETRRDILTGATTLASGRAHACATTRAGGVLCWGDGEGGALGDGDRHDRGCKMDSRPTAGGGLPTHHTICAKPKALFPVPRVVGAFSSARKVAVGDASACALEDGRVSCWGSRFPPTPTAIDVSGVVKLAGSETFCARTEAGAVTCWGLGQGTPPERVAALEPARAIDARWNHACAVVDRGAIRCIGKASDGLELTDWTAPPATDAH